MIFFRIISIRSFSDDKKMGILSLSEEMMEYLLTFCDLKSLFKVRLASTRLYSCSHQGVVQRVNLNWKFYLSTKMDPLRLIRYYPTLYFANLTMPIHISTHALSELETYGLKADYADSFLTLYPNGNRPLTGTMVNLKRTFVGVLNKREIIAWTQRGDRYEHCILSREEFFCKVYQDAAYKVYAIPMRDRTTLETSVDELNPNSLDILSRGMTKIVKVYNNDEVIIAKLADERLIYLTDPQTLKPPPEIPLGCKIKNVYGILCKLFLAWLDNGEVLVWGANVLSPGRLLIPDETVSKQYNKVRSITVSNHCFTILLDDERTIIQYGYFLNTEPNYKMISLQLRDRSDIKKIFANDEYFVALLRNGKIYPWSQDPYKNVFPAFPEGYQVRSIFKTLKAFTILLEDGSIVCFGARQYGGQTPSLPPGRTVKKVFSTIASFVAVLDDHTVLPWGNPIYGGQKPTVLVNEPVKTVFSNNYGFLAILENGRACYWKTDGRLIRIPENRYIKDVLPNDRTLLIQLDTGDMIPIYTNFNGQSADPPLLYMPKGKKLSTIDRGR